MPDDDYKITFSQSACSTPAFNRAHTRESNQSEINGGQIWPTLQRQDFGGFMPTITVNVNGKEFSSDVETRTLLSTFIREGLGLTGTHVGCDTTQCGACVVSVNGETLKSCSTFAWQVDGAKIETIEGLANGDTLHPMQAAFKEHHGLQCGFCTPGMVMTAVDMVKKNPDMTEAEIRHGLEGNICRCTGYQHIVEAIQTGAKAMKG